MKPTLGWDSCAISYCNRVDNKVLNEINSVFLTNEKFKTKFDAYEIPRMQLIYNMNIVIKNDKEKDNILKIISYINEGHTYIEIIEKLNSYGILKSKFSDDNLLQLICYDYEVDKNKRKIYREAKITYR